MSRIDRYIFRLTFVPLVSTLVIAAMLLLLEKMLNLFDFVVNEGGPVSVVWRMLGNLIPEYMALGIPIGVLLGVVLAFRRLALSSELDALRAVGISYGRMLRVPFGFALVFALINFGIVGFLQPWSRYNYEGLRYELRTGALGASIKVGEFAKLGKHMTLRVEQSRNQGRDLSGVFVRAQSSDGRSLAVTAARGQFLATDNPDVILLRLMHGTLVHDAKDFPTPRVLSFEQHDLPIDLPATEAFRSRGGKVLERELPELLSIGADRADKTLDRQQSIATLNRRLVQCVVMFLLPWLGVALAVPPKRSTSAVGIFLAVIMLVTFHKMTEYGERMGGIGRVDPVLAQWVPFILFGLLCYRLYSILAHKPGGQPIGALDRAFTRAAAAIRRLVQPGIGRLGMAAAPTLAPASSPAPAE